MPTAVTTEQPNPPSPPTTRLPFLFLIVGSVLRVVWLADMEWKYDEKWMFAAGLRIARGQAPLPWVGMPSGVGLRNPGLSIWPFAALASVFDTPVTMAQAVAWLNVLALWALVLWVWKTWSPADRELGLWTVALFAVSPLAVLFSRKIWAQDVLILLVVPWLWGHRRRETRWGSAVWGFFGALLGQVHMSGFFAAAALFAVALAHAVGGREPRRAPHGRRWHDNQRFEWLPWLAGSVLGALPLIPWALTVFGPTRDSVVGIKHFSVGFFTGAVRHAFGLGLEYSLEREYKPFLHGPGATHLNALARYGLLALLAFGIISQLARLREHIRLKLPEVVVSYLACVLLTGLALFVLRVQVYPHYLIVFGPLVHLGAAWLLSPRRLALAAACALQAFLSASFAFYVHTHGGVPGADYGTAWRAQKAEERALSPE